MIKDSFEVFETLFEAISEGVLVVNKNQQIIATNSSVEQMFGYAKEELLNSSLDILIPNQYKSQHSGHVAHYYKNSSKRQMSSENGLHGQRKNGDIFPIEVGLNPFDFMEGKAVMAIVVDITERKRIEQEIKDLNAQLEEKISIRTKELKNTVNELQDLNSNLETEITKRIEAENKIKVALKREKELNELKTNFLSLVSHEFKTPLSGILSSSQLLSRYTLSEQQEKRDKHLKVIKNKVHYLNNILNDFLSIEKLEMGKVSYTEESIDLSSKVQQAIEDLNPMLKNGQHIHLEIHTETPININFDVKTCDLILNNVIHNAMKYTPEFGKINIHLDIEGNMAVCSVIDSGIGIPEKDQKHIFNRYFRAENALLNPGTGIGLNIVKHHLENLSGSIWFESKENEGSTFKLKFPLCKS